MGDLVVAQQSRRTFRFFEMGDFVLLTHPAQMFIIEVSNLAAANPAFSVQNYFNRRKAQLIYDSIECTTHTAVNIIFRELSSVFYNCSPTVLISNIILSWIPIFSPSSRGIIAWQATVQYFSFCPFVITTKFIVIIIVFVASEISKHLNSTIRNRRAGTIENFEAHIRRWGRYTGSTIWSSFVGSVYTFFVFIIIPGIQSNNYLMTISNFMRTLLVNFAPSLYVYLRDNTRRMIGQ